MLLIGLYCKWNKKDNSNQSLSVYYSEHSSCSRKKCIEQVKVQWKHFGLKEDTWEMENHI